ncbi:putative Protein CNPPD1 [Hypsibius exemplaris]|uniref:Protein CNPPD1 n=1 Tax=Hypsibius exemplaris TaxID=2072580 RepID=A0A1W0WTC3_HYPEX|nr:putative Protein CNPPD1 [Hypsibius exemplaris]
MWTGGTPSYSLLPLNPHSSKELPLTVASRSEKGMAFGDKKEKRLKESPDSLHDLMLDRSSLSPSFQRECGTNGAGHIAESNAAAEESKKDAEVDGELEEDQQTFEDHDDICRRLERSLGLNCFGDDGRSVDDWTELASVIGYHYAEQMNPAWVRSAGKQNISPSALLLCLIYMERLHVTNPDFRYRHLMTSSDLFVVSLMSACKFLYDVGETGDCYNGTWARHCRIPIKRLNRMEVDFLNGLDWNLQSEAGEFATVMDKVQTDIVRSNLRFHTSMTYADLVALSSLSNGFSSNMILECIASVAKIFAALTASYILFGVLTLTIGAPIALSLTGRASNSQPTSDSSPTARSSSLPLVSTAPVTVCSVLPSSTAGLTCNDSIESLLVAKSSSVHLPKGPYRDLAARRSSLKWLSSEAGLSLAPLHGFSRMGLGLGLGGGGAPNMAHLHFVVF